MGQQRRWTVSAWMTDIPLCIPPSMTVRSAFAKMRISHFRHLLVVKEGKLVGIVTDRDLRRPDISDDAEGWMDFYNLDDSVHVSDIMTRKIQVVAPEDPLLSVHDVIRAAQELLATSSLEANAARAAGP
jgi:acetoin utilization protein AcuB